MDGLQQDVPKTFGQIDVGHLDCMGKQRSNLLGRKSRNTTSYRSDQEYLLGLNLCIIYKLIYVGTDGFHPALHRRNGVALALWPHAHTHNGAKMQPGSTCSTAPVHSRKVASEDKYFIGCQLLNKVWGNSMIHFTVNIDKKTR